MLSSGGTPQNLESEAETIVPEAETIVPEGCVGEPKFFSPESFPSFETHKRKTKPQNKRIMLVMFPLVCKVAVFFWSGHHTKNISRRQ